MEAQGYAQVGRRGAAKHGQGQVGRDGANAAVDVALVLLLGIRDATQRGTDVDRETIRPRTARAPSSRSRIVDRQRPAANANWLKRSV